jgi:hypothetical protein
MAGDDFEASAFECRGVSSPRGAGSLVRIQRIGLDGGCKVVAVTLEMREVK